MTATTLVLVAAILVATLAIAAWLERGRGRRAVPVPAAAGTGAAPGQIDRADFVRPGAPWVVVLFSSRDCGGCREAAAAVAQLESADVAVDVVEWTERPDLQRKYAITGVPVVVLADRAGVTRASFVGAETMAEMPDEVRARIGPGPRPPGAAR